VEKHKSKEEIECEAHFVRNVSRDTQDRYIVRLPFRKLNKRLGDSRTMALRCMAALERRLNKDAALKTELSDNGRVSEIRTHIRDRDTLRQWILHASSRSVQRIE